MIPARDVGWALDRIALLSWMKGQAQVSTTLRQLADLVQGELCGDADLVICAARSLGEAEPGSITFVEDEKHAQQLDACRASAVVAPKGLSTKGWSVLRVADPMAAFAAIVRHLHGRAEPPPCGIDPHASIHPTARIGDDCSIYPFVCIGEGSAVGVRCRIYSGVVVGRFCRIGDDVTLYPNAVLYDGTVLGDRAIIHANAVLGADGFGYRFHEGRHTKVPQLGHVEIGADVEVGACTTIDRGTFQATRIGEGTKIDNLVMIAHNCQIGRHNLFISQMGIAGSSSTGDYVVIAGQAGIVDHVRIGERAMIGAQAGVTKEVPAGQRMLGSPATPEREQKRVLITMGKLPEIRRDVQRIKQHLGINEDRG
jgi:UDP-3-O-[3-hydroxymyristoyl] glucosamine N-acyltransferase